jgi:hypothetical protein
MKKRPVSFLLCCALALAAVACADHAMHLDKLQAAFASAQPETKAQLDTAIADINKTNFTDALPILQKIAFATKMNHEQRDILEDTIRKVRQKMLPAK